LGRSGGVGYITANPQSYKFVKEMRDVMKQNPTETEKIMWEYLRNKKTGHKIRRQHIIDDYITDFVCLSKNIVIEIDGKIHLKQKEYDEIRTQRLNELGYEVIRFTNEEVFSDPELVTSKIKQKLDSKTYLTLNHDQSNSLLSSKDAFMPIDLLDFIYASFFYYDYNEKLNDFLSHDLLKVQIPKNKTTFWQLVKFGREIRQIHMFESPIIDQFVTVYPAKGDNLVSDISYRGGHTGIVEVGEVYINNSQYFANVPELVWRFSIANFYPAQKWLKDRKGSKLDLFEIMHYQKLIISLSETIRLIFEINKLEIE
jgi:very-short-patch-repair endonuclease